MGKKYSEFLDWTLNKNAHFQINTMIIWMPKTMQIINSMDKNKMISYMSSLSLQSSGLGNKISCKKKADVHYF